MNLIIKGKDLYGYQRTVDSLVRRGWGTSKDVPGFWGKLTEYTPTDEGIKMLESQRKTNNRNKE